MIQQIRKEVKEIDRASEEWEQLIAHRTEIARAITLEKWVRDAQSSRAAAETRGLEKGKAEGLAEGLAEGKEEARHELALKLKKKGFSAEEILELTGVDVEKLQA